MEYSIVIPAYNEADKITTTLRQVVGFMRDFSSDFEIIVVDDGSTDSTATLVKDFSKDNPEVRLVKNPHKGKGPTVWKGMMKAEGELIYMADADLATPISELRKLANWISDHDFDIVIASREGAGAVRVKEPAYRHLVGRVFNMFVQIIALPGIKDSQCGFKLFKKKAAKDIFKRMYIYGDSAPERSQPFFGAFDVEVLYLAKKLDYKVKELPVLWNFVKTNRFNFFYNSFNMAKDVLKVRLNDMRGVYGKK